MAEGSSSFLPWEFINVEIFNLICRICTMHFAGSFDKEDMQMEAFLIAKGYYESEQRRSKMRNFKGWLYSVCLSAARDARWKMVEENRRMLKIPIEVVDENGDTMILPEAEAKSADLFRTSFLLNPNWLTFTKFLARHPNQLSAHCGYQNRIAGHTLAELALEHYGGDSDAEIKEMSRLINDDLADIKADIERDGSYGR